jgi:hypothetical protein
MSLKDLNRNLTASEVEVMKLNRCSSDDWNRIRVKNGFDPSRCVNVIFSGDILLGVFKQPFIDESGVSYQSGIFNTRLHNCKIGSDVVIHNISDCIANYNIEDKVVIKNCVRIHTEGRSSFGNGRSISVLSETGARAVKIWDRLSSHEAYIAALYRHKEKAIAKIEKMTDDYASSVTSEEGTIGYNSRMFNCTTIRNVKTGPFSYFDGVLLLNEGSVNSCKTDPVFVGPGVIMENFIVCSGSRVSESALVENCFIGQGSILAKQFSAQNSLFFANFDGSLGEACSVFAGPYTVTHHKSTMLLAGYFSFMNAGSGTNQSNHMYKLGPVHQGILERGTKTTSNSYLMWPSHIGSFTIVKGSHGKSLDSSSFPFSYIIESNSDSILIPGINLRSVGTIRDAQKWPLRDRRKDSDKIDKINFNMLNPSTVGKMIIGRNILLGLKSEISSSGNYSCNNMQIKSSSVERGIKLYQIGINKFIGKALIRRIENRVFKTTEELQRILTPKGPDGRGEWVDLAGLITPKSEVEKLLVQIESGKLASAADMNNSFAEMHKSYFEWEWTWVCEKIEELIGISADKLTTANVIDLLERWEKSVLELDTLIYEDAEKEFAPASMTGFGIDGGEDIWKLDFKNVRGDIQSNSYVMSITEHTIVKTATGDGLINRLRGIIK